MKDAITLKSITGFNRMSSGLRIQTSADQVRTRPGSEVRKPLSYLTARKIYPFAVDFARSLVYFIETRAAIDHNGVPFLYRAVFDDAVHLIEADIESFVDFVEALGVPKDPDLIFIHHPGRCGSTLLHKLLGSHPDVESVSEDLVLENFLLAEQGERGEKLYAAVVRLTAFKFGVVAPRKLAFKFTGFSQRVFDRLAVIFPRARHIYLTRDPIRITESWINAWRSRWLYRLGLSLRLYNYRFVPCAKERRPPRLGTSDPYFEVRQVNQGIRKRYISLSEAWLLSVLVIDQFFNSRTNSTNLLHIRYEDILSREKIRQNLDPFLGFDFSNGLDEARYDTHSQLGSLAETRRFRYHKLNESEKQALARFQLQMSRMIA